MKIFNKILVAVDGSDSALHALEYSINLAKETNAKLEVIYIVPYAIGNIDAGILPSELEKKELNTAKSLLEIIQKQHKEVEMSSVVSIGKPIKEIQTIISKWNADLFVIGHHTHSVIHKILNGSVESDILKHLKCPLLIIPQNYTKNEI